MPNDLLYIWALNTARSETACQYYRIHTPFYYMEKSGLAHFYEDQGERVKYDTRAMISADVCQFYMLSGGEILTQVAALRKMNAAERPGGDITYPPVLVYDLDDNTDFVHPMNFTFCHLGVRTYPEMRLLRPGEKLEVEWPDGTRETMWEDLATENNGILFDIERNLKSMKERHQIIRTCHGTTVSTPELGSYIRDVVKQPNVYVFPNSINLAEYEEFPVLRENPDEIRIFWQGSMSHWVDWYPLKDAIKTIAEKYPKVKWVIWGSWFDWVHECIPDSQVEYYGWQPYAAYKLRRGLMNIDINLCPLADNAFNRCKSAIKWYEGSIWKHPEAVLASNCSPYSREIVDGETGMLFKTSEEFVTKLSALIDNEILRKKVADGGKKWVLENRTVEKTVPGLHAFYHELKLEQKAKATPKIVVSNPTDLKKLLAKR